MANGKKTGGRKKGVPNKATIARKAEFEAAKKRGLTPLQLLQESYAILYRRATMKDGKRLRDDEIDEAMLERACAIAKDAAPYLHPRLNAIQHTGKDGEPIQVSFTGRDAGAL